VHGGTNAAAVRSNGVDILAHPGLIAEADAEEAAKRGIFLELSARPGHCWGNGHVYSVARKTAAPIAVDSDAHDEAGLLSVPKVCAIVRGAGGSELMLRHITETMAPALLARMQRRRSAPRARTYTMPASRLYI
jgi:histidinol phosphatase-like PHP family hydrolase